MLTKEDLANIKGLMDDQVSGIKGEITGLKGEMAGMKEEITEIKANMVTKKEFKDLENRVDDLQQEMHELRDYSHKKFVLIENEVVPKISALYEMSDSYVRKTECSRQREQADKKFNSIESLEVIAKIHSEQLAKHDEILDRLVTNAG